MIGNKLVTALLLAPLALTQDKQTTDLPDSPSSLRLPAVYVSASAPADELRLNTDYTLSLRVGGQTMGGTFRVDGSRLQFSVPPDAPSVATLAGNQLTDGAGQVWVLRAVSASSSDYAAVLRNRDIVALSSAGVPDAEILAKISNSKSQFQISADAILQLSQAGASTNVLRAMRVAAGVPVNTNSGGQQANPADSLPPLPAPATSVPFRPGINWLTVDSAGNVYFASNNCVLRMSADGMLNRVAGKPDRIGYSGDGGAAVDAELNRPEGLAVDAGGTLYIADYGNNAIRKVSPAGAISTVAGNGTRGFTGDGGPARSAQLYHPSAVSVDTEGNLFILDATNRVIRRVDSDGIISTFVGDGPNSNLSNLQNGTSAISIALVPSAIAVDNSGSLYVSSGQRVFVVNPQGTIWHVAGNGGTANSNFLGDNGPAKQAQLTFVTGLAVDASGNLYISDSTHARIRKVDRSGVITTIAGTGTPGYSGDGGQAVQSQMRMPRGLVLDGFGNLYFADSGNSIVRKVDNVGMIATVAGKTNNVNTVTGLIGRPAPDFHLTSVSGDQYNLENLRGKVVLLDFWATWCSPCRWSVPALERIQKEFKGRGVVVLGVDRGEDPQIVARFVKSEKINYPILMDALGSENVASKFGVNAIPTLFLIDRGGNVVGRESGWPNGGVDAGLSKVHKLLAEAGFDGR